MPLYSPTRSTDETTYISQVQGLSELNLNLFLPDGSSYILHLCRLMVFAACVAYYERHRYNMKYTAGYAREENARKMVLPILLLFIWLFVFADIFTTLVNLFFIGVHRCGDRVSTFWIAIESATFHALYEGLAILLCRYGIGYSTLRSSLFWGLLWGAFSFIVFFMLAAIICHSVDIPKIDEWVYEDGKRNTDRVQTIIYFLSTSYNLLLLGFYLFLYFAPLSYMYRRPALYYYAQMNICFQSFWLLTTLVYYCTYDTPQRVTVLTVCTVLSVIVMVFLKPYSVCHSLLLDSMYWQGFMVEDENPTSELWLTNDEATASSMASQIGVMMSGGLNVLHFGMLELDHSRPFVNGGYSRVYFGKKIPENVEVAIKIIYAMELSPFEISALCKEGDILHKLRHPNIVECKGICVMPPALALVFENCAHGSLFNFLHKPANIETLREEDDFFGISPGPLIKAKLRGQQANKANKANKANNEWSSNSSSSLRESSSSVNMLDLFSSTDISPLFSYSASNANTSSSGNGNNSGASASNDRQNKGIGIGIDAADSRGSVGTGNVMARMSQQGQSRPSLSLIRSSLTVAETDRKSLSQPFSTSESVWIDQQEQPGASVGNSDFIVTAQAAQQLSASGDFRGSFNGNCNGSSGNNYNNNNNNGNNGNNVNDGNSTVRSPMRSGVSVEVEMQSSLFRNPITISGSGSGSGPTMTMQALKEFESESEETVVVGVGVVGFTYDDMEAGSAGSAVNAVNGGQDRVKDKSKSSSSSSSSKRQVEKASSLAKGKNNNNGGSGGDSDSEMSLGAQLSLDQRLGIMLECVSSIAFMHRKGYMHCDIKSLNYLVSDNFHIKLADMGDARLFDAKVKEGESPPLPARNWAAPELLMTQDIGGGTDESNNNHNTPPTPIPIPIPIYTKECDVYGVAMVLAEIACLEIPFGDIPGSTSPKEWVRMVGMDQNRPKLPIDLPRKVANVIKKGWEIDPKKRCTAEEMLEALVESTNAAVQV